MIIEILEDGFFAAMAAIGFASISNPLRRIYPFCAVVAAVGHIIRYILTTVVGMHLIWAGTIAAFCIGFLSIILSSKVKCPAETCFFPALLPMIPGMYAYRAFAALLTCLSHAEEAMFMHYFYLLAYNGMVCVFVILGMVIGVNVPVFLLKNTSFQATR